MSLYSNIYKIYKRLRPAGAALLAFVLYSGIAQASYLPTTGSNIGIGTSTPVGGLVIMNGNVGIGTWSPIQRLQVVGTIGATAFVGDGSGLTGITGSGWTDGGTNVYTSTTTDNVGIGTTTPAAKLDIRSSDGSLTPLAITGDSGGGFLRILVNDTNSDPNARNWAFGNSLAAGWGWDFMHSASQGGAPSVLAMRIDDNGNVGIGTSTPVGGLTVMSGNVGIGTWKPSAPLEVYGVKVNTLGQLVVNGITLDPNTNGVFSAGYFGNSVSNSFMKLDQEPGNSIWFRYNNSGVVRFMTDTADVMRITDTGNVGVGTVTPLSTFVVAGGGVGIGTHTNSSFIRTTAPSGGLIAEGNVGIGTTTPVGALAVMNGNVGIGTWSPTARLQVIGTVNATAFVGDGSGLTGVTSNSGWTDGGTNVYTSTTTDNVGIGTTTPNAATLEIVKNAAQSPFKISGTATSNGDFLNVSSVGRVGIGTTLNSLGTGLAVMNGRVGIGTWNPTFALDVFGGARFQGNNTAIVLSTNSGTTYGNITLAGGGVNGVGIASDANSGGNAFLLGSSDSGVVVNSSGNVGIGTNTAVGALTVMNGNVGIGTWKPSGPFTVKPAGASVPFFIDSAGDTHTSGSIYDTGAIYGTSNSSFIIYNNGGAGTFTSIAGGGGTDSHLSLSSVVGTPFSNFGTTDYINFGVGNAANTASVEAMRIVSGGNIGIGTSTPVGALTVMSGNVGIGTWSPVGALEVKGLAGATRIWTGTGTDTNATSAGELYVQGDLEVDGTLYGDGSGLTGTSGLTMAGGWTDGGTNVYTSTTTDNVAIGTTTPSSTLEIVKTAAGTAPLMVSSVATADGDYLIVSSSGNIGIGTTRTTTSALSVMTGNVGIGTWKPRSKLQITDNGTPTLSFFRNDSSIVSTEEYGSIEFYGNDSSGGSTGVMSAYIKALPVDDVTSAGANSALLFGVSDDGTFGIREVMRIDNHISGNPSVGIGTTTSLNLLTVAGGASIGSDYSLSFAPTNGLLVEGNVGIGTSAVSAAKMVVYSGNVGIGTLTPVGGTAIMNGNVGLGTWSPRNTLELRSAATTQGSTSIYFSNPSVSHGITGVAPADVFGEIGMYANDSGGLYIQGLSEGNAEGVRITGYQSTSDPNDNAASITMFGAKLSGVTGGPLGDDETILQVWNGATTSSIPPFTILGSMNVGIGTSTPGGALTVLNGNVGIGTWKPIGAMEIKNGAGAVRIWTGSGTDTNATAAGELYVQGDLEVDGTLYGDGSGLTGTSGLTMAGGWTDGGTNVYTSTTTDNVAIGTTTPSGTLEIVKTAAGTAPLMVSSVATADGDYLVISSSGNIGIGTTTPVGGLTVMNGNVGIGTWNPANQLDIKGSLGLINPNSTNNSTGFIYFSQSASDDIGGLNFGFTSGLTGMGYAFVTRDAGGNQINGLTINNAGNVGLGTLKMAAGLTVMNGNVGIGTWSTSGVSGALIVDNNAGNVGIGTIRPGTKLDVNGTVRATAFIGDGSGLTNVANSAGWTDGGTNVYTSTTTDNVGIGTTTPNAATLEIVKNAAQAPLKVSSAATGSGDYLLVSSGGNIGIGQTSPLDHDNFANRFLQMRDTNGSTLYLTDNSNNRLDIAHTTTKDFIFENTSIPLGIYTNSAERISILAAGNVGISTTKPASRLVVNGGVGIGTVNTSNFLDTTAPNGGLLVEKSIGVGTTLAPSTTGLTVMTGNVGIGTWSPVAKLEVSGAIQMTGSGDSYFNGNLGIGNTSPAQALDVTGTVKMTGFQLTTGASNGSVLTSDGSGVGTWQTVSGTISGLNAGYLPKAASATSLADSVIFALNNSIGIGTTTPVSGVSIMNGNLGIGTWSPTDRLIVTTGNVGIGTVKPPIAMLDISSAAAQDLFRINDNGTGDTTPLIVDQNGNLGIGTSTAGSKLVVRTSSNDKSSFGLEVFNSGNSEVARLDDQGRLITGMLFGNAGIGVGTTDPQARLEITNGTIAPLEVSSALTAHGDMLMVTTAGNVGLGTITPVGGLTVMNGNVGIGTWSPTATLHVIDTSNGGNTLKIQRGVNSYNLGLSGLVTGDATDMLFSPSQASSGFLFTPQNASSTSLNALVINKDGNVGLGTLSPVAGLAVMSGNVGIGTWSPIYRLQVIGTLDATTITQGGVAIASGASGWTDGGTNVYQTTTTDVVGIGTTTPAASTTLEIVKQASNAPLKISGSATGAGNFLMIDSAGNVGIGTNKTTTMGLSVMTGPVGIGTWTTQANPGSLNVDAGGQAIGIDIYNANTYAILASSGSIVGPEFKDTNNTNYYIDPSPSVGTAPSAILQNNVGIGTSTPVGALVVMNGNVGIGTWVPAQTLDVKGGLRTFGNSGDTLLNQTGGNVGIGTTTPSAALHVVGSARITGLNCSGNTNGGAITADASGNLSCTDDDNSGGASGWTDGGTNVYEVTTSDNVGVGTTTPLRKLDVLTAASQDTIGLRATSTSAYVETSYYDTGNNRVGSMGIGGSAVGNTIYQNNLYLETNGGNILFTPATGKIGIGDYTSMSAPTSELQVQGKTTDTTAAVFNATNLSNQSLFLIRNDGAVGIGTELASSTGKLIMPSGNVGIGTITPVNGTAIMNGNVGIGTWSPTARLQVIGTVNATAFVGDGSGLTNVANSAGWTDGGPNVYTSTTTDNVGIGTTTPVNRLSVQGNIGIGTFAAYRNIAAPNNGMAIEGNVGIGTWTAGSKLDVWGTVRSSTNSSEYSEMQERSSTGNASFPRTFIYSYGSSVSNAGVYAAPGNATGATQIPTFIGASTNASSNQAASVQIYMDVTTAAAGIEAELAEADFSTGGVQAVDMFFGGSATQGDNAPLWVKTSGNVGIGTATPNGKFIVWNGNVGIGTAIPVGGTAIMNGNVGIGTWSTSGVSGALIIANNAGNVGIGTIRPGTKLDVNGTVRATAFVGDGSGLTGVSSAGGWTDGGPNVYTSTTTDNVAIGTTTPSSTLEIVKTAAGTAPFMVSSTATRDGDMLLVNSAGQVGIGTTLTSATIGTVIANGNVGIGTWSTVSPYDASLNIDTHGQTVGLTILSASTYAIFANTGAIVGPSFKDTDNTGAYIDPAPSVAGAPSAILLNNVGIGTGTPVGALTVMNGNVGIGTWSPIGKLEVKGAPVIIDSGGGINTNATGAGELYVQGDLEVDGSIYGDGQNITNLPSQGTGGWTDGGTNVFTTTTTDNVGVGTTTPTSKMNVAGSLSVGSDGTFRTLAAPPDGLQVQGNVGIGTVLPVGGLVVMNGNVGIGTWSPGAAAEVSGVLRASQPGTAARYFQFDPAGRKMYYVGGTSDVTTIDTANTTGGRWDISQNGTAIMSLQDGGNVGIGTVTPVGAFTVMNGNVGIGTWSPTGKLEVRDQNFGKVKVGVGTTGPLLSVSAEVQTQTPRTAALYINQEADNGAPSQTYGIQMEHGDGQSGNNYTAIYNLLGSSYANTTLAGFDTDLSYDGATGQTIYGVRVRGTDSYLWGNNTTLYGINVTNAQMEGDGTKIYGGYFNLRTDGTSAANTQQIYGTYAKGKTFSGASDLYYGSFIESDSASTGGTQYGQYVDLNAGTATKYAAAFLGGNVGIGTATPRGVLIVSTGNVGIGTLDPVGGLAVMSGNVGIGTWSPTALLEVKGAVKFSSGPVTRAYQQLWVQSAKLPTTNAARIDAGENNWRLLFDPTTSQSALWQMVLPQDYASTSSPQLRVLYTMNSATAGNVIFRASVMAVTAGDAADINTDSYDTTNTSATTTVPGTAGFLDSIVISLSNMDSAAAGDLLKIKLDRDAATDTAAGDAEVVGVVLEYTKQ
jgi:hypothetical protein